MNCRFVFTWYNIKHLITRETVNFVSLGSALGNIEILGKKINFFLRDQALSDLLHSLKFCSWKFIKPCCIGGHQSTLVGNSARSCYLNIIDFAMLLAQRFWQETVSFLLDVTWPQSIQPTGKKVSAIKQKTCLPIKCKFKLDSSIIPVLPVICKFTFSFSKSIENQC